MSGVFFVVFDLWAFLEFSMLCFLYFHEDFLRFSSFFVFHVFR